MDNSMFIPIQKVDLERREVWGWAAVEEPDNSDEVMDYVSSKPHWMEWSQRAQKRSGGRSLGNLRAMHQNIAAGKLIDLRADDMRRGFYIGAKIIDDNEWKKVTQGVYTGFSVGGSYLKRWMDYRDQGKTRYTAKPTEVSIVDAPCIPSATFEVVKADGLVEIRHFRPTDGENVLKWEETKHPRANDGKFAPKGSGGGGGSSKQQESKQTRPSGPSYRGMSDTEYEEEIEQRAAEEGMSVTEYENMLYEYAKEDEEEIERAAEEGIEDYDPNAMPDNFVPPKSAELRAGRKRILIFEDRTPQAKPGTFRALDQDYNEKIFASEKEAREYAESRLQGGKWDDGGYKESSSEGNKTPSADRFVVPERSPEELGRKYAPTGEFRPEDEYSEDELAQNRGGRDVSPKAMRAERAKQAPAKFEAKDAGDDDWADDDEILPEGVDQYADAKQQLDDKLKFARQNRYEPIRQHPKESDVKRAASGRDKLKESKGPSREWQKMEGGETLAEKFEMFKMLANEILEEIDELEKVDIPGAPEEIASIQLPGEVGGDYEVEHMPEPSTTMTLDENVSTGQEQLAQHAVKSQDLSAAFEAWLPKVGAMVKAEIAAALELKEGKSPSPAVRMVKVARSPIKVSRKEKR